MLTSTHPQHFNRRSIRRECIWPLRVCYALSQEQVPNTHSCSIAYQTFLMLQPIRARHHVDNNKNFMLRHSCCFQNLNLMEVKNCSELDPFRGLILSHLERYKTSAAVRVNRSWVTRVGSLWRWVLLLQQPNAINKLRIRS
jgi:hypothetical protein